MENKIIGWLARDADDRLFLYETDPYKSSRREKWYEDTEYKAPRLLDSNLFPEVKWEDKKPTKVELTINIVE